MEIFNVGTPSLPSSLYVSEVRRNVVISRLVFVIILSLELLLFALLAQQQQQQEKDNIYIFICMHTYTSTDTEIRRLCAYKNIYNVEKSKTAVLSERHNGGPAAFKLY
uniref:Uncharacterized protein n=1 Tax=Glossina brevipalpis TaxID=37001 RepID=A0A1A9W5Y8_9MUSC